MLGAIWGPFVSTDSDQTETAPRKFTLGPLGNLNQVTKGLAKTIRAMADGTLDSQVGARICNGLGIIRACLETQKLEQLEGRMDEIADRVAHERYRRARALHGSSASTLASRRSMRRALGFMGAGGASGAKDR